MALATYHHAAQSHWLCKALCLALGQKGGWGGEVTLGCRSASLPLLSGSGFDPHPQRLPIFHLILGVRSESLIRRPGFPEQGSKSPGNCSGSSFWPDQVLLSKDFPSETWLQTEILIKEVQGWGWGSKFDPHRVPQKRGWLRTPMLQCLCASLHNSLLACCAEIVLTLRTYRPSGRSWHTARRPRGSQQAHHRNSSSETLDSQWSEAREKPLAKFPGDLGTWECRQTSKVFQTYSQGATFRNALLLRCTSSGPCSRAWAAALIEKPLCRLYGMVFAVFWRLPLGEFSNYRADFLFSSAPCRNSCEVTLREDHKITSMCFCLWRLLLRLHRKPWLLESGSSAEVLGHCCCSAFGEI